MEVEPGGGWADAVSKILRMGTNNPESNKILSKAKIDQDPEDSSAGSENSDTDDEPDDKKISTCLTTRLKPDPQADALLENALKSDATRGVVHLFNAVKTVNPKSDKKKKKKKKKKKPKRKFGSRKSFKRK